MTTVDVASRHQPGHELRLLYKSCQMDWRNSQGPDLEINSCQIHFLIIILKKIKIGKKFGESKVADWEVWRDPSKLLPNA
jgi:hypothetical protein